MFAPFLPFRFCVELALSVSCYFLVADYSDMPRSGNRGGNRTTSRSARNSPYEQAQPRTRRQVLRGHWVTPAARDRLANNGVAVRTDRIYPDRFNVPWLTRATANMVNSVVLPGGHIDTRLRLAYVLRRLEFGLTPIGHWLTTLRMRQLSTRDIDFLLRESHWNFLIVCWIRDETYGMQFSFDAAVDARRTLRAQRRHLENSPSQSRNGQLHML